MKFFGQWNPPVDKVLYDCYFKNKKNGFFIEAGACDGVLESCCLLFEKYLGWNGINIEPDPYLYDMLIKNRTKSININIALSNKSGKSEFTHVIHPNRKHHFGNGSIKHTESHKKRHKRTNCKYEKFIVKTETYNEVIERLKIKEVDLFVLDVEGHELKVLETITKESILPKVMCIEYLSHKDKLDNIMKNKGYKLDQKMHNNAFYVLK